MGAISLEFHRFGLELLLPVMFRCLNRSLPSISSRVDFSTMIICSVSHQKKEKNLGDEGKISFDPTDGIVSREKIST
jgi:hypothetical protein